MVVSVFSDGCDGGWLVSFSFNLVILWCGGQGETPSCLFQHQSSLKASLGLLFLPNCDYDQPCCQAEWGQLAVTWRTRYSFEGVLDSPASEAGSCTLTPHLIPSHVLGGSNLKVLLYFLSLKEED